MIPPEPTWTPTPFVVEQATDRRGGRGHHMARRRARRAPGRRVRPGQCGRVRRECAGRRAREGPRARRRPRSHVPSLADAVKDLLARHVGREDEWGGGGDRPGHLGTPLPFVRRTDACGPGDLARGMRPAPPDGDFEMSRTTFAVAADRIKPRPRPHSQTRTFPEEIIAGCAEMAHSALGARRTAARAGGEERLHGMVSHRGAVRGSLGRAAR